MAAKRRSLGKGLDALLSGGGNRETEPVSVDSSSAAQTGVDRSSNEERELRQLPIEHIERGQYQPRREFSEESLRELADSIRAQGLMQPIVVRPTSADRFEIIAGERRWRACQLAGLDTIAALVREIPDEAAIAMALIENIQREDLNPIEEAMALARLQHELDLSQQEVADAVGKSRSTVANLLRLNGLESSVRQMLSDGHIDMGHGRALLALEAGAQRELAQQIAAKGLSVRQTEAAVKSLLASNESGSGVESDAAGAVDPNIRNLEDELARKLGASVSIRHSSSGKGSLTLKYGSLDELDGILAHLR